MNFQFYLEKLLHSKEFEKFKSENPKAYLCSGFFSVDKQGSDNQQHLDFYLPSEKKMFSFQVEKSFEPVNLDKYDEKVPEKIEDNFDFDFDEVEKMISDKMNEEKVNKQIQKLLFSLQNKEGKNFIIATVFISGLGILKVMIDLEKKEVVSFEKKSFFDMMKVIKK